MEKNREIYIYPLYPCIKVEFEHVECGPNYMECVSMMKTLFGLKIQEVFHRLQQSVGFVLVSSIRVIILLDFYLL